MAEDDASKAYAAVSAKLDSWTSPKVGKMSSNWRTYEDDAVEWMETTMAQNISLTPQKRPANDAVSPTSTPVTSNSAKKPDRSISPLNLLDVPIFPPAAKFSNDEYRMYHDALASNKSLCWTLARLSKSTGTTHAQLIYNLYGETSTLLMQRRKALVEWLQGLAAEDEVELPTENPYSEKTSLDADLVNACLHYILSGRLDKAVELCKEQGQPWRAAIWQGGRPFEIVTSAKDETRSVVHATGGNPERILWKSQCRKLAKKTWGAESAIYAILADDVQTALASASLRSWERGLLVCLTSLLGRTEDELLHRYNGNLRKAGVVFPGSYYEEEEMEHMLATSNVAAFNEYTIFDALEASPFKDLRAATLSQKLMVAFIRGRLAVQEVLTSTLFQESDKSLRMMTHLLIYLDSLPIVRMDVQGLSQIKDHVVLEYMRRLAKDPDLSQHITLYASMLPTSTLLSELPALLTNIQVPEERCLVWKQMNDFFDPGVDVNILQRVVRLILSDVHSSDVQKCQSIGWLCFTTDHYGPALVCANELVRQLLLSDKTHIASQFLWDYFPTIVQEDSYDQFMSAKREHSALLAYLEANAAFDNWKECMIAVAAESTPCTLNHIALSEQEKVIAYQMEKRRLIDEKREAANRMIDAANTAQSKLDDVLTFEGGWLQEYDDDDDEVDSSDDEKRQLELEALQARLIPQVVFLAHNVFSETATWMQTMLEDGVPVVGKDAKEVLSALDKVEDLSPFAPLYWLTHAHDLANKVASEEHGIYDAFGETDLKHFLELMVDIKIRVLEVTAP
ncbi:hypothetical protein MHU86_13885 [Fragilaria crotonensis]|nr:hypothetical protein MHU86_13885 [Fragilaria crotonensis]